jgi:SAM-dependent methyltransferase
VSEADERHRLRASFDATAELYDRSRLVAPRRLFDDLVSLAGLEPGARLLELGCGTGQATGPLAERGFEVVGLELGESLADLARQNLAAFPRVRIVNASFEAWEPEAEPFDAVVSFNAFHWLDPDIRLAKSAAVLRPGGALAVMGSAFGLHEGADATWLALAEDYEAVVGELEPRPDLDAPRDRSAELESDGWFRTVGVRRYRWQVRFDADAYIERLRTSSWHGALAEDVREELFARIRRRILASPGRAIAPTTGAVLYVAERIRK